MRYLCVLDLSETSITSLPDSIGTLRLLKYLNLSGTRIEELPESLSDLRHLQFLDVSNTRVRRLHSGIDKHKYMLHLNFELCDGLEYYPVGISKLIYLQTLKGVRITVGNAASAKALQLRDLKGLTLLQHLSLMIESNQSGDHQVEDEGTFRGMIKMRTLYVQYHGSGVRYRGSVGSLYLPTDMEAMERLEIVDLCQCAVPKWIFQLQNLMELTLQELGNCSSADLTGLEKIPNLKKLHLGDNWNPHFIGFPNEFGEAGAFPKLEELVIEYFKHLKSIPSFHEDAMPRLRYLRMDECENMSENMYENIPEGLTKLKNLKEVELIYYGDGPRNSWEYSWENSWGRQIKIREEAEW
jgi:Leucine-rich repeat (LRR) protein